MGKETSPYLSIVVTGRNDDHGENFLGRTQLFVDVLLQQLEHCNLRSELIVVEWNPPADRPSLSDVLVWRNKGPLTDVRFIIVPSDIHNDFKHSKYLPLYQMIAKNVGIRRARGEFVLATNTDILLSNPLMEFLASSRLTRGRMYRVDRYDVGAQFGSEWSIEQVFRYCHSNILRRHGRFFSSDYPKSWFSQLRHWWYSYNEYPLKRQVHTNASGDFTLMARDDWFELQAYPELDVRSTNVDSLLCFMAHFSGCGREKFLGWPRNIFHIDHSRLDGDTSYAKQIPVPLLGWDQVYDWALEMSRSHKAIIFNNESWGMPDKILPEATIESAAKC